MGNTVFAVTTVLTSFMGGLALGSFLAGRFVDKSTDPLRIYGILELLIGIYAIVLPVLIGGTEPLFRFIYQNFEASFYTFSFLRFVVCAIILLIPTTLMGATLPVLSRYFVRRQAHLGWTVGRLYGVNTLGAALGSFSAGFALIPNLGLSWTIYLAAFLNISIGIVVLNISRKSALLVASESDEKTVERKKKRERREEEMVNGRSTFTIALVMAAIGLSGVAAMIYQVVWTRVLTLFIGSSVYAFSLIVTAFILGLALGSLALARFIDRRRDLVMAFAVVEGAIGASGLLLVPVLGQLPPFVAETVLKFFDSFEYLLLAEFAIIFVLMLIPTFLMGAAFPIAAKICTMDIKRVGRLIGDVYAVNTVGAIIGAFVAGFLLIPWLGTQNSLFVAVAINLIAASALFLRAPTLAAPKRAAATFATIAVVVFGWHQIPSWDTFLLTSGPYLYSDLYRDVSKKKDIGLEQAMREGRELLYFKEGLHATVSVKKTAEGDVALEINGKTDATAKGDASTQLMLGHLPLLLQEGVEDVLIIGLGSGMTLGAVELYPVKRIDVVELERAVVEASEYFKPYIRDALNDERVNVIVTDGRNHLALSSQQYDVIISEPSNVWISGMANLFTKEFFELARRRLRKGGLMCQWLYAYSMSRDDFKTIVRTFQSVFPHASVWEADLANDYVVVGSAEELNVDLELLESTLVQGRIRSDLLRLQITDLSSFLSKLVIVDGAVSNFTTGAPLHTDDNVLLEYSTPKVLLEERSAELLVDIYKNRTSPGGILQAFRWGENAGSVADDLADMFRSKEEVVAALVSLLGGEDQDAIEKFKRARALNPGDYDAAHLLANLYYEMGSRYEDAGFTEEARDVYTRSVGVIDDFLQGDTASLSNMFDLDMVNALANLHLGIIYLRSDSLAEAADAFHRSLRGDVRYVEAYTNLGVAYERQGRYGEARNQYEHALELNPTHVSALINFGNIYLIEKDYNKAIESFLQVIKLRPDFAIAYYNLGVAYFNQGEWAKASEEWEHALELNPNFPEAKRSLELVRKKMKEP